MTVTLNDVVGQVRARVRTAAPAEVRHIAEDVLAEHGAPLAVTDVVNLVSGMGPLQHLLDDPTVEEIWVNEPTRVFVARAGRTELTGVLLDDDAVRMLVERMLAPTGRRVDVSSPFVDATLPDGSRLHVAIPDITRNHWAVNIRKFVMGATSLPDLVAVGTLTQEAADFLASRVAAGDNIIVAGATQAGKTTLMNILFGTYAADEGVIRVNGSPARIHNSAEALAASAQGPGWRVLEAVPIVGRNAEAVTALAVGASDLLSAAEPLAPWRVRTEDGLVNLVFTPEGARAEDRDLQACTFIVTFYSTSIAEIVNSVERRAINHLSVGNGCPMHDALRIIKPKICIEFRR